MKKSFLLYFTFLYFGLLCMPTLAQAQFTCPPLTVFPSDCPSNGKIVIDTSTLLASTGTAPYQYRIITAPTPLPTPTLWQTNPAYFSGLLPGSYCIEIRDANLNTCTACTTVVDQYTNLDLTVVNDGCNLKAQVTGGHGPFTYTLYNSNPTPNPPTPLQTNTTAATSFSYTGLTNGQQYYVRVTDACGEFYTTAQTLTYGTIAFSSTPAFPAGGTSLTVALASNTAPSLFTYKIKIGGVSQTPIVSSALSVTFNNLPHDCTDNVIEVIDTACRRGTITISNLVPTAPLQIVFDCLDYSAGIITCHATGGIPPYVYWAWSNPAPTAWYNFAQNSTGIMQIPVGTLYPLALQLKGKCYAEDGINPIFKPLPNTTYNSTTCSVTGSFANTLPNFYPITATCTTCTTPVTQTITSNTDNVNLSPIPLNSTIKFTDNCNNVYICKDTAFLETAKSCTSIQTKLKNAYTCEGPYLNPSIIAATYTLYSATNNPLDTNTTGYFPNLQPSATYTIKAVTTCGTVTQTITLDPSTGAPPPITINYHCYNNQMYAYFTVTGNSPVLIPLSGGSAPINPVTIGNTHTFDTIPAGTYTYQSGCQVGQITINPPTLPNITPVHLNTFCVNGVITYSIKIKDVPGATYEVRNAAGTLFPGTYTTPTVTTPPDWTLAPYWVYTLPHGTYTMQSGCTNSVTVVYPDIPVTTKPTFYVYVDCADWNNPLGQYTYTIYVRAPGLSSIGFTLIDGNNNPIVGYLDGDAMRFSNLPPGQYTTNHPCLANATIDLKPFPVFKIDLFTAVNCPGNNSLIIKGGPTLKAWIKWRDLNYSAPNAIPIELPYFMTLCNYGAFVYYVFKNGVPFSLSNVDCSGDTLKATHFGITPGTYTVKLLSCRVLDEKTIVVGPYVTPTLKADRAFVCDNGSVTDVKLAITNGSPPYTYQRMMNCDPNNIVTYTNADPYALSYTVPALPQGDYCFRVIDGCGVTRTTSTQVAKLGQISPNFKVKCGFIQLKIDKIADANYQWYNVTAGNTAIGTGDSIQVAATSIITKYKVVITNGGPCSWERFIEFASNEGVIPQVKINGALSACYGDSIALNATIMNGAIVPINNIKWYQGTTLVKTGATYTAKAGGIYTVTASNAYGCKGEGSTTLRIPTQILDADKVIVNINCFNAKNGSITLTPKGGLAPYTYAWSIAGATSASVNALDIGTYSYTITDDIGCKKTGTAVITQPQSIAAKVARLNTNDCSAIYKVSVNPTFTNVEYSYDNLPWTNNATSPCLSSPPSAHSVKVRWNGAVCDTTLNFSVPVKTPKIGTITKSICFGDSLKIGNDTLGLYIHKLSGVYSDTLRTPNTFGTCGSCDSVLTVNLTIKPKIETNITKKLCFGSIYTIGTQVYTATGIYVKVLTAANGCDSTVTLDLTIPPLLAVTSSVEQIKCFSAKNGSIALNVSGGFAPYTYLWNNGATTATLNALDTGIYSVIIKDSINCIVTHSVTITQQQAIAAKVARLNTNDCSAIYKVSVNPTFTDVEYSYDNLPWTNNATSPC